MRRIVFDQLTDIYPSEIVTGGAEGPDLIAEYWAYIHRVPCRVFKPDWEKFGKSAGAVRNRLIVDHCDQLIAFWDGKSKGTKISIDMASEANKLYRVFQE